MYIKCKLLLITIIIVKNRNMFVCSCNKYREFVLFAISIYFRLRANKLRKAVNRGRLCSLKLPIELRLKMWNKRIYCLF